MSRSLEGRVAVVTGAASGIGRSVASAFAAEGARLALLDRAADAVSAVAADLSRSCDVSAISLPCDVRSRRAVRDALGEAAAELGGLGVLVCSAGMRLIVDTLEMTAEEWEETLAVNLSGTFFCCQAAAELMRERSGGTIVNIASISGLVGESQRAAYVASKHGVVGLTKALAADFAQYRIRVNAVCPGLVRTPMTEQYFRDQSFGTALRASVPLGSYGEPRHIADVAAFLASDKSEYITGTAIAVDGGFLAEKAFVTEATDQQREPGGIQAAQVGTEQALHGQDFPQPAKEED